MVKETIDERALGNVLLNPSASSQQEAHQAAVQNIAGQLFGFPTPESPHFRTFVNEPTEQQKIFTNYGNELTPDIVVLEWPEKIPVIVAEVVTPDMLRDDLAAKVWAVEARLDGVRFYLYVPAGHASEAKKLLKRNKIKDVGLRTWRNNIGMQTIDIGSVR